MKKTLLWFSFLLPPSLPFIPPPSLSFSLPPFLSTPSNHSKKLSMSSTTDLSTRIAIVTGASSGIGEAIVTGLSKGGCKVALAARRGPVLEALKAKLVAAGVPPENLLCVPTDVSVRSSVQSLVSAAEDSLGPVDVMVNCAGVMYFTLMKNANMDEWDSTIDVNIKGVTNGFGCIIPKFLEVRRGGGEGGGGAHTHPFFTL